jgi:hypothetical protein
VPRPVGAIDALTFVKMLGSRAGPRLPTRAAILTNVSVVPKTCTVSFRTAAGEWVHVTAGVSVFDAAAKALAFFNSNHWHGPRPQPKTVLEVALVGGQAYRVRCAGG